MPRHALAGPFPALLFLRSSKLHDFTGALRDIKRPQMRNKKSDSNLSWFLGCMSCNSDTIRYELPFLGLPPSSFPFLHVLLAPFSIDPTSSYFPKLLSFPPLPTFPPLLPVQVCPESLYKKEKNAMSDAGERVHNQEFQTCIESLHKQHGHASKKQPKKGPSLAQCMQYALL